VRHVRFDERHELAAAVCAREGASDCDALEQVQVQAAPAHGPRAAELEQRLKGSTDEHSPSSGCSSAMGANRRAWGAMRTSTRG